MEGIQTSGYVVLNVTEIIIEEQSKASPSNSETSGGGNGDFNIDDHKYDYSSLIDTDTLTESVVNATKQVATKIKANVETITAVIGKLKAKIYRWKIFVNFECLYFENLRMIQDLRKIYNDFIVK